LKGFFFLILGFFVCILFPFEGSPVGNPNLPFLLEEGFVISDLSWSNPQCGFAVDYLIQKRLRPPLSHGGARLSKASLSGLSELGVVAWSIRDRFNLQLQIGSGQFSMQWQQKNLSILSALKGGLLWGCDGKLVLLGIRDTSFGIDAQAGGWDWMGGPSTTNGVFSLSANSLFRYWQVGVAMTQKISLFSPYIGWLVNRSRSKVWGLSSGTIWLHARHDMGPFGGCSLSNGDRFLLNIEWRGWFETGVSLSGHIRF
jgi:hypothetical protein